MSGRREPIFLIGFLVGIAFLAFFSSVLSYQALNCASENQKGSQAAPTAEHAKAPAPEKQAGGGEHHVEKHPNKFKPVCGLIGFFPSMFAYFNDNEGATVGSATLLLVIATLLLWKKTDDVMVSSEESNKTANRAWVFAEPKFINGVGYQLFVKNYGKTPSQVTEILLSFSVELPETVPDTGEDHSLTLGVEDQGFLVTAGPRPHFSGARIAFGFVKYTDVFNEPRISRFCFRIAGSRNISVGGAHLRAFT